MTCEEFLALAPGLALGALDPEERVACEAHLREALHRGCPEALDRARATTAALAGALAPVRPPGAVWDAIAGRAGIGHGRGRMAAPLGWAAAAAAGIAIALWQGARSDARRERELAAAARAEALAQGQARAALQGELEALRGAAEERRQLAALLDAPGSRVVALGPVAGRAGRATAVVNLAARRAWVVSAALAPQAGKVWQLWVLRGSAPPVPAGFLRFGPGGLATGEIEPALLAAAPDALAVSLEPAGGSAAPTDVYLAGRLAG